VIIPYLNLDTATIPTEVVIGTGVGVVFFALFVVFRLIGASQDRSKLRAARKAADAEGKLFLPERDHNDPTTMDDWFVKLIARSGTGMTTAQGLAISFFFAIGLTAIAFLWLENVYLAGVGFLLGMLIPMTIFGVLGWSRRRKLQAQLPDALFLMSRAVRAGLTLDQSIELASQQVQQPLAEELRKTSNQIRLGLTTRDALATTSKRIQLIDFDALVSTAAVYQSMDRLALSARDHNTFRGYFLAATAQGRITAIFIGLAAPALLVASYYTNPEWIEGFFRNPNAPLVTAIAIGLEIIGIVWLYRILKVDY
jgi:tight adherence protein B